MIREEKLNENDTRDQREGRNLQHVTNNMKQNNNENNNRKKYEDAYDD